MNKMKRSEFVTFLDTTPDDTSATYKKLGIGITEYAISYNPQVDTEKWIIEDNARTIHSSNQKQSSVSQTIYKDDDCYQFVRKGLDKISYKTHILDINCAEQVGSTAGVYEAKLSDGVVVVTSYMGEDAKIEYDLYYDGDPIEGKATINETTGVPTFTPNTSI